MYSNQVNQVSVFRLSRLSVSVFPSFFFKKGIQTKTSSVNACSCFIVDRLNMITFSCTNFSLLAPVVVYLVLSFIACYICNHTNNVDACGSIVLIIWLAQTIIGSFVLHFNDVVCER